MTKLEIIFCLAKSGKNLVNLHLYCLETKGYSSIGGASKDDIIKKLLQWPIERNASYKQVTCDKFIKLTGMCDL